MGRYPALHTVDDATILSAAQCFDIHTTGSVLKTILISLETVYNLFPGTLVFDTG